MAQPASTNLYGDIMKMLEQFRLPGIDVGAILESRRKDIEAVVAANRVALEGMQSLGRKQLDILHATLEQLRLLVHEATAAGMPAERSAKVGEAVQQILQRALENMRVLADTAYKAQSEAVAVVNRRLQENIAELKALLQQKT
jgi:phasin family protein